MNRTRRIAVVMGVAAATSGVAEQTIFDHATETPGASGIDSAVMLGVVFRAAVDGEVRKVYFWKAAEDGTTSRSLKLYNSAGDELGTATTSGEATGVAQWLSATLEAAVSITASTLYVAAVHFPLDYTAEGGRFTVDVTRGDLTAVDSDEGGGNGRFTYSATPIFPTSTSNWANYWIDVGFYPT